MFKKRANKDYTLIYPFVDAEPEDESEMALAVWHDDSVAALTEMTFLKVPFTAAQLRQLACACLEAAQELELLAKERP